MGRHETGDFNYAALFSGLLVILLGGTVLFGWAFDYPFLTRINPRWNPMVPSTALAFVLSGVLLSLGKSAHASASRAQQVIACAILLLAGARAIELAVGREFGVEFLASMWLTQAKVSGHMSPLTVLGFLLFGLGTLATRGIKGRPLPLASSGMAIALIAMGASVIIGYWLDLRVFFESVYIQSGLIWMSLPTAAGMTLLGFGLWQLPARSGKAILPATPELRAKQIYRATIVVVATTAVFTGAAGVKYLDATVLEQSSSNFAQLLESRRSHFLSHLEGRTDRAIVIASQPGLQADAASLLRNPGDRDVLQQATQRVEPLLDQGFTGVGLEQNGQFRSLVGRPIPDSAVKIQLHGKVDRGLAWDRGYYLRVRIPIASAAGAVPTGFLVLDQSVPSLDLLFDNANRWGETGILALCARSDSTTLTCFPQREHADIYQVEDTIKGEPIPMAHALAGETGVRSLVNYLGHQVLAAYGPVGDTGLGLVLRMDLAELYEPAKKALIFSIPLMAFAVALALWFIRLRVKPMLRDIADAHAAEHSARTRFDAAMQGSLDGFVIYEAVRDPVGNIVDFKHVYVNHQAEEMLGRPVDGLLPHGLLALFPNQRELFGHYHKVATTGTLCVDEFRVEPLNAPMGSSKCFLRQVVPMPEGIAVTFRDITQEKQLRESLEASNRLRNAILDSAAYSIISTDIKGTILTFNQAAERMLWYRAEELVGKATPEVFHDAQEVRERAVSLSHELGYSVLPGFEVFVAKARTGLTEEREWTFVRKDGSRLPVRLSVTALRDESDTLQGFLGVAYDISEQKRAEEYIRHIALHDLLTGLPNRALLDDRVEVSIEQHRRDASTFALAMIDIDRFKHINDSMGHHIGDLLLKAFIERVKSCLRPTDTLARMGGDEFVLLLPGSNAADAETVAHRVLRELTPPFDVGLEEVHITASIGISQFPKDGQNIYELLRCADVAMYWVKEHGRNGCKLYTREMETGGADRLRLERDLHLALEKNGFVLFYQPKIDLKSGRVFGFEALIRMRRTEDQLLSPIEFIPLAEDTGLIGPIGQWVLDTACRDAAKVQDQLGIPFTVAVNISPRQFMSGDLVTIVRGALERSGLAPSQLELEITESVLMDEHSTVSEALTELHALGVGIAIDDFGTGYSSLGYLKRYPISTLKVDQSFVRDVPGDTGDAAVIVAIISMGHSLGIRVVAEGIETEAQMAFLLANHCDRGQGFHIGKPMAFEDLLTWLSGDAAGNRAQVRQ